MNKPILIFIVTTALLSTIQWTSADEIKTASQIAKSVKRPAGAPQLSDVSMRLFKKRKDKAEWEATELLISDPDFALARLEFAFPFKDPRVLDSLLAGLREAGLPD